MLTQYRYRSIVILYCWLSILSSECFSEKIKYRGCYLLREKSSLLKDASYNSDSLTPDSCVEFCRKKNFPFAGIENKECRCGYHVPSDLLKRSDSECHYSCHDQKTLNCGGKSKVSVYETGIKLNTADSIPTRFYLGCYKDANPEYRVLKGSWNEFPSDNSPQRCHLHCFNSGFRFFGLTYMKECFCGDTVPSSTEILSESECNAPCTGDAKEMCGGGWRLSVYATGITDYPEVGRSIGCFKNLRSTEIKSEYKIDLPKSNTNRRCLNMCHFKGYIYSGIENKTVCICTNSMPISLFLDEEHNCNKNDCPGDATEKCGGPNRVKMYQTRHGDKTSVNEVSKLGCFEDRTDFRTLNGYKVAVDGDLTPKLCIDICKEKGFVFSGVEAGNECFCSHSYPSRSLQRSDEDCGLPCENNPFDRCGGFSRIAVYETGLPRSHARTSHHYLGCFRDDNKDDRLLKGSWQQLENNSPNVCHKLCLKTGFLYFGLTWIKECFCGDEDPSNNQIVSEDECNKECGGDSNKKCGGGWRLSVYKTGLEELSNENELLGCFQTDGSLLSDYSVVLPSNKPARCIRICDQIGYLYAGVERSDICRCGNTQSKYLAEASERCNFKCPGAKEETCGSNNYIKIYRTTVQDAKPSPIENSTNRIGNCKMSDTTKNGKSTCKYELIFDENFNHLDTSKWKHTIKMADEPDYEFVTYSSSPNVTFVKNGILHIMPQIQPEEYVHGKETLAGCTGKARSNECVRTATSFNILPPVLSAQITTANSFSFRFGRIDFRAKLPTGDWIIPQIWLTPKESVYGAQYLSGQIRIAMARGNKNLQCDGVNMGNRILETGILIGPTNFVRKVVNKNESNEEWSKNFHNFSLLWGTDDISFYVDGSFVSRILKNPSDSVPSVAKFPQNIRAIWEDGSRLAPFDKEFYITLGVSVGGIRDFPDSCLSNENKKPWENGSPKGMFNFYGKRSQWGATTWSGVNSALQIDHIKIAAL